MRIRQTDGVLRLSVSEICCLRLFEESDADELYTLIDANRTYLSRWMPWAAAQGLQDTLGFIRTTHRQLVENDGFQTAIVCDGSIIGVVGYHAVNWNNRSTSIGYWLGERHQGEGTMTRAVRLLVDHALRTWNLTASKSVSHLITAAVGRFQNASDSAKRAHSASRPHWGSFP